MTIVLLLTLVTVLIGGSIFSQNRLPEIDVQELSSNLYKFSCGVNNWLVLAGPDGVLLSDSAPEIYSKALELELKKFGYNDVKFIINTHWHHDHTGGNFLFGRSAAIIAHHNVRKDLSMKKHISLFDEYFEPYPNYALPNLTFSSGLKIYFNGEEIEIKHFPNGHSGGDAVVYFKNAKVIHIGDLIVLDQFPPVDIENGGDVEQLIKNLEIIEFDLPPDIRIVSGHLQDISKGELIEYCNMLRATVEIVKKEMEKGTGLKYMQEKEILKNWKSFGKHITCNMWIETIYNSAKKH